MKKTVISHSHHGHTMPADDAPVGIPELSKVSGILLFAERLPPLTHLTSKE